MDSGRYSSKTPDGIIASPLLAGMEGGSTIKNNVIPVKGKEEGLLRNTWKHRSLLMLCLPGIIFFFVFCYLPMFGIVVAFQDFNVVEGITGSAFVGLRNFKFFFQSPDALKVILNTLFLNTLFIATSLVMSLAIAIMLSEVKGRIFKKISQSIIILPHFISWTVVAMMLSIFLSSSNGIVNHIVEALGGEAVSFYTSPGYWPVILVILKLWQGAGFGSIVYLAAIMGIDQEIYEAAAIDGAGKIRMIFNITLPLLKNTVIVLLIMNVGKIFNGDFGMVYALVGNNSVLYPTTDIIDTYVYRALMEVGDMGMSAAVGLSQSIVGFIFVMITNKIARKVSPESALF